MTPRRAIAAAAAVITVLVLQATLLTPLTAPASISLPALLVAAVGIEAGPSAGMSVGFSAGLLADLGSQHQAGVLAFAWLVLGTGCGLLADPRRRLRSSVVITAAATAGAGLIVTIVLAALQAPSSSLSTILALTGPSALGDLVLAVAVVPCVRAMRRALRVRLPALAPRSRVPVDG